MIRLRLTPAQQAALECRDGGGLDPLTDRAWDRGRGLAFAPEDAEGLADELTDASNGEDAQAELRGDRAARGAALALANLSLRVARAGRR